MARAHLSLRLQALARLTRIEHEAMLCLAVFIGEFIALGGLPPAGLLPVVVLSLVPPFMLGISAFAINDYFDVEIDRRNRRLDRPLVSGEISPSQALELAVGTAVAGVAAAFLINLPCFLIALAFAAFSFLYSWKLKFLALLGNTYVAFTMAVPFVFGGLAVFPGAVPGSIVLFSLIAFVAGVGREVMGAVRDIEGDRVRPGAQTLPMIVGTRSALAFAGFLFGLAIALSFVPFLILPAFGNLSYAIPVGACDVLLAYVAVRAQGNTAAFLSQARTLGLLAMGLGLLGFLLGASGAT